MSNTYLSGNTIRIKATFYDFDNQLVNPQIVKFILYDSKYNKIDEYMLSDSNRVGVGVYFYDYITQVEQKCNKIYYEFYGEIGGKPSINRGEFLVKFR